MKTSERDTCNVSHAEHPMNFLDNPTIVTENRVVCILIAACREEYSERVLILLHNSCSKILAMIIVARFNRFINHAMLNHYVTLYLSLSLLFSLPLNLFN